MKTKRLQCTCCGVGTRAYKQWYNQDTGYGICPSCFARDVERDGLDSAIGCYGKPNVHHSIKDKDQYENK